MADDVLGISAHVDVSEIADGFQQVIEQLQSLDVITIASANNIKNALQELGNLSIKEQADVLEQLKIKIGEITEKLSKGQLSMDEVKAAGILLAEYYSLAEGRSQSISEAYEQEREKLERLSQQMEILVGEGRKLAAAGDVEGLRKNSQEIEKLADEIERTSENVKSLQGLFQASQQEIASAENAVNRFNEAGKNAKEQAIDQLVDGLIELGEKSVENTAKLAKGMGEATVDFLTGGGKFQESIEGFKDSLDMLPAPIKSTIAGVKGMTSAMWAMVKTPLGMILAGIALALQAVFTWFKKSETGQKVYAKLSAYIGSILQSLTEILVKVGDYLYHAFADANGPLNQYASNLVNTLGNALKAVYFLVKSFADVFAGLNQMFEGHFELGWESLKRGGANFEAYIDRVKDTWSSAYQTAKSFAKGVGQIGSDVLNSISYEGFAHSIDDMLKNAKTAMSIADQNLQLQDELNEYKSQEKAIDMQIADLQGQIASAEGKEKDALIAKLKAAYQLKDDKAIELKIKEAALLRAEHKLRTTTLEDMDKEQAAISQIIALQAKRAADMKRVSQMEASATKAEERKQKAAERAAAAAERKAVAEGKRETNQSNAITKAEENYEKISYNNAIEEAQAQTQLMQQLEEAEVAAMKDGAEKKRKQRAIDNLKELQDLANQQQKAIAAARERQKKDFDAVQAEIKARGGKIRKMEESDYDKQKEEDIKKQYERLGQLARQRQQNEEEQRQSDALRDFLKQYGDYQQKKLAIAEEYAKKIAEAESPAQAAALTLEKEKAEKQLAKKQFEESVDWSGVFSELKGHTKEYLQGLANQLQQVIKDGALPPDQLEVVRKKLHDINDEISKQGGLFDFIGDRQREHNRLLQEAQEAQEALVNARLHETAVQTEKNITEFQLRNFAENNGWGRDIDLSNDSDILNRVQAEKPQEYERIRNLLIVLRKDEAKLAEARENTAKATKNAEKAEDATRQNSAQAIADWFADAQQFIKQKGIDQIPALLDEIGLGGASEKAQQGLDMFNNAAGAAADFASGNYVGAALKGIQAIGNLGNLLGIGGSSDKSLEEDIEKLTASNEALRKSVDMLAEKMEDSSLADALTITKDTIANIKQSERNTAELMRRSGAVYDSGTMGLWGGKHSSNSKINNEISASEWARVTKVTGASVASAERFWSLTSEQMYKVARDAPDVYAHIKDLANDGYKDAAQFMDEYTEYWKQIEEAQKRYYEKMTSTSFDSVLGDFTNLLMDMEAGMYDSSKTMEKYLQQAVINGLVNDEYKNRVKTWYEQLGKAMEDGLTEEEAKGLRNTWDEMTKEAMRKRDQINDLFGFGSTDEGSGAFKSASSFTQDQGDELNGRLVAIQIGLQQGIMQRQGILEAQQNQLGQFVQLNGHIINIASDITNLREMQWDSLRRLTEIRDNTNVLPSMASDIKDMRNDIRNKL